MLFSIPGMILVPMCFLLRFCKAGLGENDGFNKSLLGPSSSSLAPEVVVH